jgi:hypothetical protein
VLPMVTRQTSVMEELDAAARLAKDLEVARLDAANQSAKHVKALQMVNMLVCLIL